MVHHLHTLGHMLFDRLKSIEIEIEKDFEQANHRVYSVHPQRFQYSFLKC